MKSPAFQFYVRDWLLSRTVKKMTGEEVKAYIYLLCESWLETPRATLPNNDDDLSVMAQMSLEKWLKVKPRVMANFIFKLEEGRWINEKLMGVSDKQQKFREWGKMGGNPQLEPKEVNPEVNPTLNGSLKGVPNLASASSSASSSAASNKEYIEVLEYLNLKSGKRFEPVESNLKFIRARFNEGFDASKMKAIVDLKCAAWLRKPDMVQYLRPATLFNAEKFAQYAGEIGAVNPREKTGWENDGVFK